MRKDCYQLQDKWYFENIIAELYTSASSPKAFKRTPLVKKKQPTVRKSTGTIGILPPIVRSAAASLHMPPNQCKKSGTTVGIPIMVSIPAQSSLTTKNTTTTTTPAPLPNTKVSKSSTVSTTSKSSTSVLTPRVYSAKRQKTNNIASLTATDNPLEVESNYVSTNGKPFSSLNSNEIMVELMAKDNHKQLIVHGPPLSDRYSMSMEKTADFIREIMAIPLLHSKHQVNASVINSYWLQISSKFSLPSK